MKSKENIVFLGMMGSGKTSIGFLVSKKLNLDFFDTDQLIEKEMGMKISKIFEIKGEKYFREQEANALVKITKQDNFVVALGGGAPCFASNFSLIKSTGISVYLQMEKVDLYNRLAANRGNRPLLYSLNENELEAYISSSLDVREEYYNQADIVISAKDFNAERYGMLIEEISTYDK